MQEVFEKSIDQLKSEGRVRNMSKCDYRNEKCGRFGHDCAFCYVTSEHLCNSCENTYPECGSTNVKFGCDEDTPQRFRENRDNIFYCDKYRDTEIKRKK